MRPCFNSKASLQLGSDRFFGHNELTKLNIDSMSERGAHTKKTNIPSDPIVVYHPYT